MIFQICKGNFSELHFHLLNFKRIFKSESVAQVWLLWMRFVTPRLAKLDDVICLFHMCHLMHKWRIWHHLITQLATRDLPDLKLSWKSRYQVFDILSLVLPVFAAYNNIIWSISFSGIIGWFVFEIFYQENCSNFSLNN